MTTRVCGCLAAFLFCALGPAAATLAADPPKTGEKRDTMIYVRSVPPGAKVSVGGKELGSTPGLFPVKAPVATVVLELEGYGQVREQVRIRADGITRIVIELKPQTPPAVLAQFGPVVERVVNDDNPETGDYLIDFETGKLFSLPNGLRATDKEAMAWGLQNGIDAGGEIKSSFQGLMGFNMVAIPTDSARWDKITPAALKDQLALGKPGTPAMMSGKDGAATMYLFKTYSGGMGALQIVGFAEKPKGVKIRYKMLQGGGGTDANVAQWPPKRLHLPDADDANQGKAVVLDLASGQLLTVPRDADGQLKWPSVFTELGKGDLFYDQVIGCLRSGRIKKWDGKQFADLPPSQRMDTITQYELPALPCRLLVTTAEKRQFEVTILSAANQKGADLEYREYRPGAPQTAAVATPSARDAKPRGTSDEATREQMPARADESALRGLVAKFVAATTKGEDFPLRSIGPQLEIHDAIKDMRRAMTAGANLGDVNLIRINGNNALVATKFADINDRKYKPKNPFCATYSWTKQNGDWKLIDIDLEDKDGLAKEIERLEGKPPAK